MLTSTGTAILLVYGAKLHPPRDGHPGMRCTVDGRGTVLVEGVGYPCVSSRAAALAKAADTCRDAGLRVTELGLPLTALAVRRAA